MSVTLPHIGVGVGEELLEYDRILQEGFHEVKAPKNTINYVSLQFLANGSHTSGWSRPDFSWRLIRCPARCGIKTEPEKEGI
jgi:hypothetical protein